MSGGLMEDKNNNFAKLSQSFQPQLGWVALISIPPSELPASG